MRKRKEMKLSGYRLVDDVTKQNTKLIDKLLEHRDIESEVISMETFSLKTKRASVINLRSTPTLTRFLRVRRKQAIREV